MRPYSTCDGRGHASPSERRDPHARILFASAGGESGGIRSGLVMVEVAVAVVILSLGMLAAFALFSAGLKTSEQFSDDTAAALFARSMFARLRAESSLASERSEWTNFWSAFATGSTSLMAEAGGPDGVWASTNMALRAGGLFTNIYSEYSLRFGAETGRVSRSLRYRATVTLRPDGASASSNSSAAAVVLEVWNGAYGPTNDDNCFLFYTEIPNGGRL